MTDEVGTTEHNINIGRFPSIYRGLRRCAMLRQNLLHLHFLQNKRNIAQHKTPMNINYLHYL